ncbi:MAG: outer membrane protein transport protein [Planctomycetota bacterium]|nr:outer membrane protein transport protein [Planctomycetota bacterium]
MHRARIFILGVSLGLLAASHAEAQLGLQLSGLGAVNRGVGGIATATPLDSIGALYWNPATMSALPSSEFSFGTDLVKVPIELDSSVEANALGPGVPATRLSGGNRSDGGWSAAPSFGMIQRSPNSDMTWGVGVLSIAGFGVNFPASRTSPIQFPQEPTATTPLPGLGRIFAEASFFQVTPAVSLQLTDHIAFGIGPTITVGKLVADPFPFAAPDNANGNGFGSYPSGSHSRNHWGGGVQAGVYVTSEVGLNVGAAVKSPQWFEQFTYRSADENGLPREFGIDVEYPLIVSLGASFTAIADTVLGIDVRYLDWSHAALWGDPARFTNGVLEGLGWNSIWTVSLGGQHRLNQLITVRGGYTFTESPVTDSTAGFNVASPLILQHVLSVGATIHMTQALGLHVAYSHAFSSDVEGPIQSGLGPVPNSNVRYQVSAHSLTAGATVTY